MLSIGEFSHATKLSIKTIRYYQDLGILEPAKIDASTGYRFFDEHNYERAVSILLLKQLGFTLKEIKEILTHCSEEEDLDVFIQRKLSEVEKKMRDLRALKGHLETFKNQTSGIESDAGDEIVECSFELPYYVSKAFRGEYSLIGKGYSYLYRKAGRFAQGKPYAFFDDLEYREGDAAFRAVIEVDKRAVGKELEVHSVAGTKAVKMVHTGPYGTQGGTYMKLFNYCRERNFSVRAPVVEHYVRGPGMIFRGDPEQYRTECMLLLH